MFQEYVTSPFLMPSVVGLPLKASNVLTMPVPMVPSVALVSSTVLVPQMYPLLTTQLFLESTVTPFVNLEGTSLIDQVQNAYTEMYGEITNNERVQWADDNPVPEEVDDNDPLAQYLLLPEDCFTDPKKNNVLDPNYFIDAFCSIEQQACELIWVLDIDLGLPYRATGRAVATYDVQLCKIIKRNSPGIEHPNFAKCNKHFQQLLLYYYDSVISAWYLGYIAYYGDMSVSNFQDWLSPIMDCLGVCWR